MDVRDNRGPLPVVISFRRSRTASSRHSIDIKRASGEFDKRSAPLRIAQINQSERVFSTHLLSSRSPSAPLCMSHQHRRFRNTLDSSRECNARMYTRACAPTALRAKQSQIRATRRGAHAHAHAVVLSLHFSYRVRVRVRTRWSVIDNQVPKPRIRYQ